MTIISCLHFAPTLFFPNSLPALIIYSFFLSLSFFQLSEKYARSCFFFSCFLSFLFVSHWKMSVIGKTKQKLLSTLYRGSEFLPYHPNLFLRTPSFEDFVPNRLRNVISKWWFASSRSIREEMSKPNVHTTHS